jgi:hypothetical protein
LLSRKENTDFLDKNFMNILKVLESNTQRKAEYLRMIGLYKGYKALAYFINGDTAGSKTMLLESNQYLQNALGECSKSVASSMYRPAILSEISALKSLSRLDDTITKLAGVGINPFDILPSLETYVHLLEKCGIDRKIICDRMIEKWCQVVEAKYGIGKVYSMGASAAIFIPFWELSLTYTFKTGAVIWAKGVKVEDKLLVIATYPLAGDSVTDIFKTNGSVGLLDQISGKETTMTGSGIKEFVKYIAPNSIPVNTKIFPPLISCETAEWLANTYLVKVSKQYNGKLTLGLAKANRLVYLPAEISGGSLFFKILGSNTVNVGPYAKEIIDASL